jgi:hypothetical protein
MLTVRISLKALAPLAGVVNHALGVVGGDATAHFFSEGAAHRSVSAREELLVAMQQDRTGRY